jgi:outer membrane protein OmpA-like peptidoglycan-associated protein
VQRENAAPEAEEETRSKPRQERRERADEPRRGREADRDRRRERADDPARTPEVTREERRERRKERREFTRDNLKDIMRDRRRTEEGGRVVIEEPGKRRIIRERGRAIIEHDETERMRGSARNVEVDRRPNGRTRTVITRPNGVQIITVEGRNGRMIRRIKRMPNGREIVLINNEYKGSRRGRRFRDDDRYSSIDVLVDLPDLILESSERRGYYANTDDSDEEELYEALSAPPLEELEDDYTLDEIRYSPDIRKRLRRINLNTVTFASGSWDVPDGQFDRLAVVARVINRIIEDNPDQVVLIGGHTDAIGSDENNLSLSDRRAETVARILTDEFEVPPENLVTQGYGESDLLVDTESDEPRNRRVEFMRITPFLAQK